MIAVVVGVSFISCVVSVSLYHWVCLLEKKERKKVDTDDARHDEILKEIAEFERTHLNWRSPKATKIAIEKLFERIRSL